MQHVADVAFNDTLCRRVARPATADIARGGGSKGSAPFVFRCPVTDGVLGPTKAVEVQRSRCDPAASPPWDIDLLRVPTGRVELPWVISPHGPEPCASANSATSACQRSKCCAADTVTIRQRAVQRGAPSWCNELRGGRAAPPAGAAAITAARGGVALAAPEPERLDVERAGFYRRRADAVARSGIDTRVGRRSRLRAHAASQPLILSDLPLRTSPTRRCDIGGLANVQNQAQPPHRDFRRRCRFAALNS